MLAHKYEFEAFGTKWSIETLELISEKRKQCIQKYIDDFDKTYSRFRSDSLVTKLSKQSGSFEFPSNAETLMNFYKSIYLLTEGKMTPLIGSALERSGYDAQYSFQPKQFIGVPSWEDAMEWNGSTITTHMPVLLDIGAAGKGYAVDGIAALLKEYSINEYVIDASGDIRHKGSHENTIGLEHPLDTNKIIGVVDVRNKSLCASATNRRTWGNGLHHIIDPANGLPVTTICATWVVAENTLIADGIATALFFTEPDILKSTYDFEYVRMYSDASVEYSDFFSQSLF